MPVTNKDALLPDPSAGGVRGRRTATVAVSGAVAVALSLGLGASVVGAAERRYSGAVRVPAAASAGALDPSLRPYWTRIPILLWTPAAGADREAVQGTAAFRTAVFSALGDGDHDYSNIDDLRKLFPDAPAGGPAVVIDQSTTTAQLHRAAANLRRLDGVQDAKVVQVTGLWFTVSATAPAAAPAPVTGPKPGGAPVVRTMPGKPGSTPVLDPTGLPVRGSAGGLDRTPDGRWIRWVRATYVGPAIDRATFDRIRHRAAKALRISVWKVVVTAESARGARPASR